MTAEPSLGQRAWILLVLCSCVSLVFFSFTSYFPAAVYIARDTGATQSEITWMVDAFTLTMAAFLLPAGAIGDRYGRRGVMNLGMALFLVGCGLALLADTPNQLIACRALQGTAAAMIMPSTLSLITTTFPAQHRQQAVAIWSAVMIVSGTIGVVGSACLVGWFHWESVTWMNMGAAVATFVLGWTIPTTKEKTPPRFDAIGALLGTIICGGVVFALIEGGEKGWTEPSVLGSFGIAAVSTALFVAVELRASDPLLDVRVFRIRPFAAGAIVVGLSFSMLYGDFYLGLLYFQYAEDMSALRAALFAGVSMSIGVVPAILVSTWIGNRISLRANLTTGLGIAALGLFVMSFDRFYTNEYTAGAVFVVLSVGVGMTAGPASNAIVDNVPANKQGVAAAVNHASRDVGVAFAIALFGSLQAAAYRDEISGATETLPPPARDASRESIAAALAVADQNGPAGVGLAGSAREAFAAGMQQANLIIGIGLAAVVVGIAVLAPGRTPARPVDVAKLFRGVAGVVRTDSGIPVAGAAIALTDLAGRQIARVYSDDTGHYTVEVPGAADHVLVATADGQPPAAALVSSNGATQDVTLGVDGRPASAWTIRSRA